MAGASDQRVHKLLQYMGKKELLSNQTWQTYVLIKCLPCNMPQVSLSWNLLGIKFLVSKIRNREGCHPLGMKKSRKEEDSKCGKVRNLDINLEMFLF